LNRESAIESLAATSPHERLKAARFFARGGQSEDLLLLRKARRVEVVSYVQASLDRAIARLSNMAPSSTPDPAGEFDVPEDVKRQLRSQAVDWVAGLLLHEVASPIGLVKRSASREINDFDASRTKRHLENLERIFESIEQLKGATATPKPERFDLAETIAEIVNVEPNSTGIEISLVGPKPMVILSDPTLVRLVVRNGFQNAIEAASLSIPTHPAPVVINWGETDVDYWVSVLDRGPGIVGSTEAAFGIGKTTKSGHSGFGLAISRQAIETLGGTVTLEPAVQGGALYQARWER
jgi:signal transduction histidine kinase